MSPEAWILAFIAAAICGIGGAIERRLDAILKATKAAQAEAEAVRHAIGRLSIRLESRDSAGL